MARQALWCSFTGPTLAIFFTGPTLVIFFTGPTLAIFFTGPTLVIFFTGPTLAIFFTGPTLAKFLISLHTNFSHAQVVVRYEKRSLHTMLKKGNTIFVNVPQLAIFKSETNALFILHFHFH